MIQTIHTSVNGRVRFRIQDLYRCDPLKHHIESKLASYQDIKEASASTLTGNVLVLFNSENTPLTIAALLEKLVLEYRSLHGEREIPSQRKTRLEPTGNNGRSLGAAAAEKSKFPKRISPFSSASAVEQPEKAWYRLKADKALQFWQCSRTEGLPAALAAKNLSTYGPNALPDPPSRSRLSMLIGQFTSLPVMLLGVASVVSIATGGVADAIAILGVVAINGVIGYVTESEAERTIESLKNLVRPQAHVIRDGKLREVAIEEVALGDLLLLRPGTYVAADARIADATNLTVDESALTGESLPVTKKVSAIIGRIVALGDRVNMVYMGTLVTGGQGLAVVVATGRNTEIGRLQLLVGEAEPPGTPLERQLERIGNQLVLVGAGACGVVFVVGLIYGYPFLHVLTMSISIAVAAIPEGLPTVATTCLAIGLTNMKRKNVLIRTLDSVETLGAVQMICFDKTGTVTENRMSVQRVFTGGRSIEVFDGKFYEKSKRLDPSDVADLVKLADICVLCSETEIRREEEGFKLKGSSTESALIHMTALLGNDLIALRKQYPLIKTTHRTEDRHFMATLHATAEGKRLLAVKGSPLEVLAMCDTYIKDGEELPLTEEIRGVFEHQNERMAGRALRVLGFAYILDGDEERFDQLGGLIWLGIIGMADPIRKGVKELMGQFHQAGIDTIMLTGDQTPTAYAIGKELNLSQGAPIEILDSSHLANIETDALRALSERVHVFARVSPAHKLQIVQALQQDGKVVAMTGDGINDSPALKAADIGVTLGSTGTDIAREVADVVLENDDLETMIVAVSHGRTIHNNIRKSIHFLLATNFSEILLMVFASVLGIGYPLTAMQLLWINLMSDIFPGLALGLEEPEPDVMHRPPRDPHEPIVTNRDMKRIGFEAGVITASSLGAYGYGIAKYGAGAQASTLAFQSLTLGQLIHAFSCRSEKHSIFGKEKLPPNHYLTVAMAGSLGLQVLTMFIPALRRLLGVVPMTLADTLMIGGTALLPLVINESTKNISNTSQGEAS